MKKIIANKIRIHRKNAGLTQQDLADVLCISHQMAYKLEKGKRNLYAEELFVLAEVLDVNVYDFMEWGKE